MATRQRIAMGFLALACLVILVCMAQRMASLHALQMPPTTSFSLSNTAPDNADDASITPCELSAKTLLLAAPLLFDSVLPATVILLLVLALCCLLPLIFSSGTPLSCAATPYPSD
ncbi:copper resistance protein [Erwinia rhapontici]|uniref:copper resistance protein n=1 Tax=Erwinia rhapontici TaxID=55212 RepID=UPI003D36ECA1